MSQMEMKNHKKCAGCKALEYDRGYSCSLDYKITNPMNEHFPKPMEPFEKPKSTKQLAEIEIKRRNL